MTTGDIVVWQRAEVLWCHGGADVDELTVSRLWMVVIAAAERLLTVLSTLLECWFFICYVLITTTTAAVTTIYIYYNETCLFRAPSESSRHDLKKRGRAMTRGPLTSKCEERSFRRKKNKKTTTTTTKNKHHLSLNTGLISRQTVCCFTATLLLLLCCNCPPSLLSLIHIWRCRRDVLCRSRWSPYH